MRIVVAARTGAREFECEPGEKILLAGLRSGVELPYECGTGTCGTCKARLVSGRVESEWPDAPGIRYLKDPADLLMCQCLAREDCGARGRRASGRASRTHRSPARWAATCAAGAA